MNTLPRAISHAAFATMLALPLVAQTTNTDTPPATTTNPATASRIAGLADVIELSPFTVAAEAETGYMAKESLAGSRMRVSLADITAPIDVVTAEMMSDFAATSVDDLYGIISNFEERNDNDRNNSNVLDAGTSYKIRGFEGFTTLRNFNATTVPLDNYNTSSLVATKGANAIFFGAGQEGGSLGYFTKRYSFGSADRTSLSLKLDSYGSYRGELHFQRRLIKNKLGILADFYSEKRYFGLKPTYAAGQGNYVNINYQPFKNTTLSVSLEKRRDENYRGSDTYANMIDNYSPWVTAGSPAVLGTTLVNNQGFTTSTTTTNLLFSGSTVPVSTTYATYGISRNGTASAGVIIDGQYRYLTNSTITSQYRDTQYGAAFNGISWASPVWNEDYSASGVNNGTEADFKAFDLSLEQKITDDLHFQLNFARSSMDRISFQNRSRALFKDPDYYIPGANAAGTPPVLNPNFGKYFIESGGLNSQGRYWDTKSISATLAYQLDLTKYNVWLGRHNLAGLASESSEPRRGIRYRMVMRQAANATNTGSVPVVVTNVGQTATNQLSFRKYIDPEAGGYLDDYRYIQRQGFYEQGFYRWEYQPYLNNSSFGDVVTKSKMFVLNSYLLKNRLITNFGYRTDHIDTYRWNMLASTTPGMEGKSVAYEYYTSAQAATPGFVRKETTLVELPRRGPVPFESNSGISRNLGGLLKVTNNVALIYNQSNNISPVASGVGVTGESLPVRKGQTQDYGLRFNFMEGKIRLELTQYKTSGADNNDVATGGNIRVPFGSTQAMYGILKENGIITVNPFANGSDRDSYDSTATGREAMININFDNGFTARLSVTKNYRISENLGKVFMPFWERDKAMFLKYSTDPVIAAKTWSEDTTAPFETFAQSYASALDLLRLRETLNGIPNSNQSTWAAKLLAKYSFRQSFMKGVEMGTNVVWNAGPINGLFQNPDGSFDKNRPFYGPDTTRVNLFVKYGRKVKLGGTSAKWTIQLNVDNVFDQYKLVPNIFFNAYQVPALDGQVFVRSYKLLPGRSVSVTNTLNF